MSSKAELPVGVRQGSVIGPMLFTPTSLQWAACSLDTLCLTTTTYAESQLYVTFVVYCWHRPHQTRTSSRSTSPHCEKVTSIYSQCFTASFPSLVITKCWPTKHFVKNSLFFFPPCLSIPFTEIKQRNHFVSLQGQIQRRCKSISLLCLIFWKEPPSASPFSHFGCNLQEVFEDTPHWLGLSPIDTSMPKITYLCFGAASSISLLSTDLAVAPLSLCGGYSRYRSLFDWLIDWLIDWLSMIPCLEAVPKKDHPQKKATRVSPEWYADEL